MKKARRGLSLFLTVVMIATLLLSAGQISKATMLPIKEENAFLILSDYSEEEIRNMPLSTVLSNLQNSEGEKIEIGPDAKVVWAHFKDEEGNVIRDEYHVVDRNETVDLSEFEYTTGYKMELIIGSGEQLDTANKRYLVRVYLTNTVMEQVDCEFYMQDADGGRTKLVPSHESTTNAEMMGIPLITTMYEYPAHHAGDIYYLGLSSVADDHPNIKVDVYTMQGFMNLLMGMADEPITDTILNQDMTGADAGYKGVYDAPKDVYSAKDNNMFFLVYTDRPTGSITNISCYSYTVSEAMTYLNGYFQKDTEDGFESVALVDTSVYNWDSINYSDTEVSSTGVIGFGTMLQEGLPADDQYHFVLKEHGHYYGAPVKAVVGHYDTLEDAADQPDIKEQLIQTEDEPVPGYPGDYSSDHEGMNFTVFYESGDVFKVTAMVFLYDVNADPNRKIPDFSLNPIVGAADPWFRVTGAIQGDQPLDVYVVENGKAINMDTYYGYGYQTIFINDSSEKVDLSSLKPTFWFADGKRVRTFAVSPFTGAEQFSGVSVRSFVNGMQQYGTIFDDNAERVRNYQVSFVKKVAGPKLFVNGPSKREVFLDEYFEGKHDILIANIGDEPLEGLEVTLDATNVRLDDYWTVGGENNSTLAAFTATADQGEYGMLPNLAKIRLLPDGDGPISGTLTITAKNQPEPVVIELSGQAENPKLLTETLDPAIKYVPYSYLIATNNMHDWNSVAYEVTGGALPDGITLNPNTGELYGAPKAEGTFTFKVTATFDFFEADTKEYTLVVGENTDPAVYQASDSEEGYQMLDPLGEDENGAYRFVLAEEEAEQDQSFRSNGEYGKFVKVVWFNGEKLAEDEYDSADGSTVITIHASTFGKYAQQGRNTIAAEFREGGIESYEDQSSYTTMYRTSQNFYIEAPKVDTAVQNVLSLIDKLPTSPALSDEAAVNAARAAYNALTSAQKNQITNYSRLTNAEAKIAQLKADKREADKVVALIDKIPAPVSLEDKDAVMAAREAYNMLGASPKQFVSNYEKLKDAEDAIAALEAAERARQKSLAEINAVIAAIRALPDPLKLEDKPAVEAARSAYNALLNEQKDAVVNYQDLVNAEAVIAALEALEKAAEADKAAAKVVFDQIDALPDDITLADEPQVVDARGAYDGLTDTQKELVTNYAKLVGAEDKIAALLAYEEASKKDQAAADAVMEQIRSLPEELKLSDKDAVTDARAAFDALTDAQKKLVHNEKTLIDAEAKLAELELAEHEENTPTATATMICRFVDENGAALANQNVELHSEVQKGKTDENGYVRFTNVEIGDHTLIALDENGKELASKSFKLSEGKPLTLSGDGIVTEDGSCFTLTVKVTGKSLAFVSVAEGDKAPVPTEKPSEGQSSGTQNVSGGSGKGAPRTNDPNRLALWYALLVLSSVGLLILVVSGGKKRTHR